MRAVHFTWDVLHGDTEKSPVIVALGEDKPDVDLTQWYVRAQVRDSRDSLNIVYAFVVGSGVELGTAWITLGSGRQVSTSSIRLVLHPADWAQIERREASYVLDVEVSTDATGAPAERYTIATGELNVHLDVTRAA